MVAEQLSLNTLLFDYPEESPRFYFSDKPHPNVRSARLSHQLFPNRIRDIFPEIENGDCIYTTYTEPAAGFKPLPINFADDNFALVKRYYNRAIKRYFSDLGVLVCRTFVNDNQVWIPASVVSTRELNHCVVYDRFTLKVNFNQIVNKPELVLSYDRQANISQKSVAELFAEFRNVELFGENGRAGENPADYLNRVLYVEPVAKAKEGCRLHIVKYSRLSQWVGSGCRIDYERVYPIVQNKLAAYFGYVGGEDAWDVGFRRGKNPYKEYIARITDFKERYLDQESFRAIIPVSGVFTHVFSGSTSAESNRLIFGKDGATGENKVALIPQVGINSGPFSQPRHNNIQLFFLLPQDYKDQVRQLHSQLHRGYKLFKGLSKYLGVEFTTTPGFSITFEDVWNPLPEIRHQLQERLFNPAVKYLAIYLTPISKHSVQKEQREIYYQVKEELLRWGVVSQVIETDKMLERLRLDQEYGRSDFSYTLQNMAIAINAKLGGTPWRIAVPEYRELIVGVGTFKHIDTQTQYIGSAFSFDNTGAFNSFEYFLKDELRELAGSIEDAVIRYKNTIKNPDRLIIHYYKDMREDEVEVIEKTLSRLNLDIPFFVVTINKTESREIIVFDDCSTEKMPYSGRYVNLGNNTYLLCNNTRYNAQSRIEGYPFPVKLKITCPSDPVLLNQETIAGLIDQVYQFSRIYWKSVRQQNLPVTIKYPEMITQMVPHFSHGSIPPAIGQNTLWFL